MDSPHKTELEKVLKALEELNHILFEIISEFYPENDIFVQGLSISWDDKVQAFEVESGNKTFRVYKWRPNLHAVFENLDLFVAVFRRLVEIRQRRLKQLVQRFEQIDQVLAPYYIAKNLRG